MYPLRKYQENLRMESRRMKTNVKFLNHRSKSRTTDEHPSKLPRIIPFNILIQNSLISFILVPQLYYNLYVHQVDYPDALIGLKSIRNFLFALALFSFCSCWGMYLGFVFKDKSFRSTFMQKLFQEKYVLNLCSSMFFLSVSLLYGLLIIFRTLTGPCQSRIEFPIDLNCNPYHAVPLFPMDTAFIGMSIPILIVTAMKEKRIYLPVLSWLIILFSLVFSAIALNSIRSIPIIITFVVLSISLMVDGFLMQSFAVKLIDQVKETMEERQKFADTQKTSEMKDVIGNVAHDLKTVSDIFHFFVFISY
jgi:hypothetical protein